MSNDVQQLEEWVVNIGDMLHNLPFSDITTESLQASTDSEEKPSIFSSRPAFVYFIDNYNPDSQNISGWHFVAFMRRWFDLDIHSYLEYIDRARSYYPGKLRCGINASDYESNNDNEGKKAFLEYLLINSCIVVFAILLFQNVRNGIEILSGTKEKTRDPKDQRSIEFYNIYQHIMEDPMKIKLQMLTMDFQIPWFLVECIYTNHSNLSKLVDTPIDKLAFSCFDDLYPGVHRSKMHGDTGIGTLPPGGFKHLIHTFHWTRTPEGKYLGETRSLLQPTKKMGNFYIPSVTDLKLSATVFEKHAGIHVAYNDKRLSGVMQIAPLHIFGYSGKIYATLLNFEHNYVDCGFPVTAYVACIMNLLLTKADVKLLRANGIVPSMGNDEKDVLRFVQCLKYELSNDVRMPNDLNILSEKVREHHERSYSRSYAELKSSYFANPWITISVIAGILLFILTFIQTILSFIQTKYSVLSYKQQ